MLGSGRLGGLLNQQRRSFLQISRTAQREREKARDHKDNCYDSGVTRHDGFGIGHPDRRPEIPDSDQMQELPVPRIHGSSNRKERGHRQGQQQHIAEHARDELSSVVQHRGVVIAMQT